jgi:hypothetical protein
MTFQFPVESGQVLVFARSVGDLDPVYEEQVGVADGGPLVVPPTFVRSAEHFDPDSLCRPHPRGLEQPGRGGTIDTVHAEQHFEYFAPLRAGEQLTVESFEGSTWAKRGRAGDLEFFETITEFRGPSGELCVRARKVSVRISGAGSDD